MSFVFAIGEETVWSPALRVGRAFVGCAQAVSAIVDVQPGFSFNGEDMVEIDPAQLGAFAEALTRLRASSTRHRVLDDLTDAVRIPCLVMLERAGPAGSGHDSHTIRLIEEVGATMAR